MIATDLRNTNFETLRESLAERRAEIYQAVGQHGPGTTRLLAQRSGIDLLTLRPRVTELEQLGLVACVDRIVIDGIAHGVYAVTAPEDWSAWRDSVYPVEGQLQMGLHSGALTP